MDNSNQETPINLSENELVEHVKIFVNKLPDNITKGGIINSTDTFLSNPDDFEFFYMLEIAKTHSLDPDKDYEEIKTLSEDENNREIIKKKLREESENSYKVTDIIIPTPSKTETPKMDYPRTFFERFDHLPDGGMVKINPAEMNQVEHVYIGGGLGMEAYNNIQNGFYGDENDNPTYFSTDYELAMSHMHDYGDSSPILIEASPKKILESRTIFQDPESFYIGSEEGKTFIAFHGIPVSAIERILVLEKTKSTSI